MINKLTTMQPGRKEKKIYNSDYVHRHKCVSTYPKFLYISINAGYTLIWFNLIYLKIRNFGREYIAF